LALGLSCIPPMRYRILIVLGGLLLTGCAASRPSTSPQAELQPVQAAPAIALAFDPAVPVAGAGDAAAMVASQPLPMISREGREVSAFGGYESITAESFDIQTDDDQIFYDHDSSYERQVFSDKVGIIYR